MGIVKRDEGKKVNSNINVTPMVDVMLVLLIIFMVITPMLNNKVNVDLPKAEAARVMEDANKEDAVTVAVTRDGKFFLGGDQVTLDDLGTKVQAKLDAQKGVGSKTVYLRADVRANYGKVMDAIDGIRSAGVSELGLLTERQDEEPAPAPKK
jgi:biopolymer transport protein TolR